MSCIAKQSFNTTVTNPFNAVPSSTGLISTFVTFNTADPEKDPTAVKFDEITFDEVISRQLKVMDQTAFTLCRENKLEIIVFDMDTPGNLGKVLAGEKIGTLVKLA